MIHHKIPHKWSGALSAMLTGMLISATPSPSTTVLAAGIGESEWAHVLQLPTNIRQEITSI